MPEPHSFWSKVEKTSTCWLWRGAISNRYGQFKFQGRLQQAHRVSWILKFGPIPKGLQILHRCDNPICVRPSHLFQGTQSDNLKDCSVKGRLYVARGSANVNAKLTEELIPLIRTWWEEGVTQKEIAERCGVSPRAIRFVLSGKGWSHA